MVEPYSCAAAQCSKTPPGLAHAVRAALACSAEGLYVLADSSMRTSVRKSGESAAAAEASQSARLFASWRCARCAIVATVAIESSNAAFICTPARAEHSISR